MPSRKEAPDLASAALKLWKSARDFGRVLAAETEDVWHGATAFADSEPVKVNESTQVPTVLLGTIFSAMDADGQLARTPHTLAVALVNLRSAVEKRG